MGILTTGTAKVIAGVVLTGAVAGGIVIATSNSGNSNNKPAVTQVDSSKASFKIIGTWVDADDSTVKNVFTADSVTQISDGQPPETLKYNWVNEQEIEIIYNNKGDKAKAKITIDGDNLTFSISGKEVKYIREVATGTAAAPADNDPINTNLTPAQKAFKDKLTGTWGKDYGFRQIFTNDGRYISYDYEDTVRIYSQNYYRITGDSTVEWTGDDFRKFNYTISFSQDNKEMRWLNGEYLQSSFKYVSEKADMDFSASLENNIKGIWVGIPETPSANEKLAIRHIWWETKMDKNDLKYQSFTISPDGTVKVYNLDGLGLPRYTKIQVSYKVSIENDVLTLDNNGVIKKYNRLKTVLD
jgi:membrane-bound inhibitor of C-type lysozyme